MISDPKIGDYYYFPSPCVICGCYIIKIYDIKYTVNIYKETLVYFNCICCNSTEVYTLFQLNKFVSSLRKEYTIEI